MATRKRLQRRGHEGLYSAQREHLLLGTVLLDGNEFPPYGTFNYPFKNEAQRRALWEDHREQLMAYWDTLPNKASRFPAAYWQYDSGEVRLPGETVYGFLLRCEHRSEILEAISGGRPDST